MIIGGGATGVEQAAEIKAMYGKQKEVTVIQSTTKLISPKATQKFSDALTSKMERMGINVIFGKWPNTMCFLFLCSL